MFQVYLPAINGKREGWLKGTIFTTHAPSARNYATIEEAQMAIAKAKQFHLARVIRALEIVKVDV